jgi:hypothetical protein
VSAKQDALTGAPVSAADQQRAREASVWMESDDFDIPAHAHVTQGEEAAASGRAALIAALGSTEAVQEAVGGRPSLDGTVGHGPSPKRQVRLPIELDEALTARAERDHRRASDIIRDALDAYLRAS